MASREEFEQLTNEYIRALHDAELARAAAMETSDEEADREYRDAGARVRELSERWRKAWEIQPTNW